MSRKSIILLADDEPKILSAVRRTLLSCAQQTNNRMDLCELPALDVEIQTASCGHDALRAFRRRAADLVVTDLNMPCGCEGEDMNGLALVEAIRGLNSRENISLMIQTAGVISHALRAKAAGLHCRVVEKESIEIFRESVLTTLEQWRFQAAIP